ncbi:hypothetical protein A8C56_11020 [Niabella ginsenosidivorans]|uniref:UspA domain-containing protein n=1 Tax=Niabella ginsenosidivorans TaxID=1176587 RepID=A0A1A9I304_9BACT|nr:universal stress protein [Niabella ginsenosidivorans]ANH81439.1 hypothetical protein A8C56_11020 [Niabella ginsenosidivorans]
MQSILVLTDFSDNAFLAAEYAGMLSRKWNSKRMVLYHAYHPLPAIANELVTVVVNEDQRPEILHNMEKWQESVQQLAGPGTTVRSLLDDADLEEGIRRIGNNEKTDLVVMGITGKTGWEKLLVGSNTIRVMETCPYPLLIVPPETKISLPETVLLTTDLKDVKEKTALPLLEKFLTGMQGRLLVLNVAKKESDAIDLRKEISALHTLLDQYHPEYHYIDHPDAAEGINSFATDHAAGLMITLHRQQSALTELLQKSISRKLAWHTRIPLLVFPVQF